MPTQSKNPTQSTTSSWIQLFLFTGFLFLLVAIPYTLYIKAFQSKATVQIVSLPPVVKLSPMPTVTPPPASTATTCIPVPDSFQHTTATPAAYFFKESKKEVCFPPTLPPFPFMWQPYTSYQYGYTIDTPSNWIDKSTTVNRTTIHIFASSEETGTTIVPTVSFAWYDGQDPYATDSSYLKQPIMRSGKQGSIYTKGTAFIAATFPIKTGYLLLESTVMDSPFYAFEHMLDSLVFSSH